MEINDEGTSSTNTEQKEFKKPVLIGKIGKLPRKAKEEDKAIDNTTQEIPLKNETPDIKSNLPPAVLFKELSTPIPYKEPKWSGLCPDGSEYGLEVLKSGAIVEKIDLTNKPYYIFGRLANCDVIMAHPTISRHHAILQYKAFAEDGEPPCGWYLYDLASTHSTFLNKDKLKPNHYTRVRVGHQIKFGNSTRTYIVLGPDFDCEGESELTVTELKQKSEEMKRDRDRFIQEAKEKREMDRLEEEKRREERGVDWGMGEDAEEEPDLADNPYATTANEELYLDDPKKTLRGYFEREGHELKYDCEERGVGQFMCRVELPIDDSRGLPVIAEVMHRGKKKEAVIACALEACRVLDRAGLLRQAKHDRPARLPVIAEVMHRGKKKEAVIACALEAYRVLDRAGLLRQAKHESRRRKERDWSADDYYDSDDDNFLDRTGAVERKRRIRMQKHGAGDAMTNAQGNKALTYDDLLKQTSELEAKIAAEEKCLERLRSLGKKSLKAASTGEDALDEYMNTLGTQGQSMAQKADISRTKMTIQKLKVELTKTKKLAELARPADMPPLIKREDRPKLTVKASNSVVYGKRLRLKEDENRPKAPRKEVKRDAEEEFVEEVDSDEEITTKEEVTKSEVLESDKEVTETGKAEEVKRVFGPMRPPENYEVPEGYFEQQSDRDLPEITEEE